ncbi:FxLD family lantipeptide [Frankia sp. B2]|uniref:FxLD family lanthipeptide n=1 Tax=unclassified Frankia TaxID=2632575 RepID=UPI00087301DC|nr:MULTISPECIES: FxLD family lanthipeptide [unclassified Frankia]OFB43224.1 hypothetical protein Manayef4_12195 [Frankia sp. CgIM4]TFE24660.1 FxLD family lantipeptide [Frankia sp. B2]
MMVATLPAGGATALLEPDVVEDDFALDVRVVITHTAKTCSNNCPTDDGCGDTCKNDASACTSESNHGF